MNTSNVETGKSTDTSKLVLITVSIIGAIIAVGLAIYITRNITQPLKRLTDAAAVMATGDLRAEDVVVKTEKRAVHMLNSPLINNLIHNTRLPIRLHAVYDGITK